MDDPEPSISAPTPGSPSIRSTSLLLAVECRAVTWHREPTAWSPKSARHRRAPVDLLPQFKLRMRAGFRHPP
jgi:hypothetical protein